ncbi:MAG: hypothetical protein JWP88_114 [Flaviaesturariibacter sp.]|nr:hypothetical protein [Flaviaesturariibacter sp.]
MQQLTNKSRFATLLVAAAFISFGATSCSKADVAAPAAGENTEELRQFIVSTTGEHNVSYDAASQDFLIDGGDSRMSLEDAKAHFKAAGSTTALGGGTASTEGIQHRKSYYAVAPAKAIAVKIYANPTVPAVWMAALDKAIANWNAAGSKLSITRVNYAGAGIMNVVGANSGATGVVATTYYPDANSNVGKSCTINTNYNYLSAGQQIFAITHELGHAFGFGHTNSTYGTLVTGTPDADPNSIMNSVCLNWTAFTAYDLQAIRTVYPK